MLMHGPEGPEGATFVGEASGALDQAKIIVDFGIRDKKLAIEFQGLDHERKLERRRHRQEIAKNVLKSKFTRRIGALALVVTAIYGIVEWAIQEDHKASQQHNREQAEAIVAILRAPEAIRALDLTNSDLQQAEQEAKKRVRNSTGAASKGYQCLVNLYASAANIAQSQHNVVMASNLPGYTIYNVYMGNEDVIAMDAYTALTPPSFQIAEDIAQVMNP